MTKRGPWEPTQSDPVPQVANGTAAQWHPTRGPTPDAHRFEQVRAKVYDAAIQIRPDLKCKSIKLGSGVECPAQLKKPWIGLTFQ